MKRRHQASKPINASATSSSGSGCLFFAILAAVSVIAGAFLLIDVATEAPPKRDEATEARQEAWRKGKQEEFEAAQASVRELANLYAFPREDAHHASTQSSRASEHHTKLDECERILKRYGETAPALQQTAPSVETELKMIAHCRRMIRLVQDIQEHKFRLPGEGTRRIKPTPAQESPSTSSSSTITK